MNPSMRHVPNINKQRNQALHERREAERLQMLARNNVSAVKRLRLNALDLARRIFRWMS